MKTPYEIGASVAIKLSGHGMDILSHGLLGGGMGTALGAISAEDGRRLKGAFRGALAGGVIGAGGKAISKMVDNPETASRLLNAFDESAFIASALAGHSANRKPLTLKKVQEIINDH